MRASVNFNPPTPGGVGPFETNKQGDAAEFQSTHPGRGGTVAGKTGTVNMVDFNPPTPGGVGRRVHGRKLLDSADFNPPTPGEVGPAAADR